MKRRCSLLLTLLGLSACSPVLPLENPFGDARETRQRTEDILSPLRIIAVDVGQGDATLVVGPSGRTLLIDGGPPTAGLTRVLPLLQSLKENGITDGIDIMAASHYDADHIAGLSEILKGPDQRANTADDVVPEQIWDRGDNTDKTTSIYENYEGAVGALRHEAIPGDILPLGDDASAEVVVINGRYEDGRSIHLNPDEENDASMGILIRYKDFSYFTAGDLPGGGLDTKNLEEFAGELLDSKIGGVDVLHLSHHGSRSSSSEDYLDTLNPDAAVISAGLENDYGHPNPEVLDRLDARDIDVYRTDERGTIEIISTGDDYEILTER